MEKPKITVLRLNHRITRDKRVTTHLLLAARALGVSEVYYSGQKDPNIEMSINKVNNSWGDGFKVHYIKNWKQKINRWKENNGEIIHLTMYGLPLHRVIDCVRNSKSSKMIIVGGSKVPWKVYDLSDWNISITNQPHSEISALSIFLHEFFEGEELLITFPNQKKRIIPQKKGREVIEN